MKSESRITTAFNGAESAGIVIIGLIGIAYAMAKTPSTFWLPAWIIQVTAFSYAISNGGRGHWPSTVFGVVEIVYVTTLSYMLYRGGVGSSAIEILFPGLLMFHGILYLAAAKSSLIRRGFLKPTGKQH